MVMNDGPWREEKVKLSRPSLTKLCCLSFQHLSSPLKRLTVDSPRPEGVKTGVNRCGCLHGIITPSSLLHHYTTCLSPVLFVHCFIHLFGYFRFLEDFCVFVYFQSAFQWNLALNLDLLNLNMNNNKKNRHTVKNLFFSRLWWITAVCSSFLLNLLHNLSKNVT